MIRAFLNSEHFQPPDGVLVTQILHERPSVGLRRRPVQNALAECGLTTADAEHLIFEFSSLNFAYEENQPPKRHKQRRTEHVIARNGEVDGKSVTIFDINYHPAAAKFDETVRRVFTDTWELIYGLKDFGVLQVVPVRKSGEKFIPNQNDTRDILVKKDTLIMLPPNIQANRWTYLGPQRENRRSHFSARYLTFPKSYSDAATKPLDLTHASNPWDYVFLNK